MADARFADGSSRRYTLVRGERPGFWAGLAEVVLAGGEAPGRQGRFRLEAGAALAGLVGGEERPLGADQSHTSVVAGDRLLVKLYRRLDEGVNPDVELTAALGARGFPHVPAYGGSIAYEDSSGGVWTLALLQELVADGRDGYAWAGLELVDPVLAGDATAEEATDALETLGVVTAELHAELAAAFGTRIAGDEEIAAWRRAGEARLGEALGLLSGGARAELEALAPRIRDGLGGLSVAQASSLARVHGDYHLGQVLRRPEGFAVVDFEGEPTRTLAERRAPESPLRDVASMLRCLDHVAAWRLREGGDGVERVEAAQTWARLARRRFLDGYRAGLAASGRSSEVDAALLRAFELEKECYEFVYAQTFLPDWLYASLAGMRELVGDGLSLTPAR